MRKSQLFRSCICRGETLVSEDQGTVGCGGSGLEDGRGLRVPCPDHGRNAGLEDPGLLAGYSRAGASQLGAMVQPDAGDYCRFGRYDVRTVQAASETDLDDSHIDLFLCEPPECHPRSDLEERQFQFVETFFPAGEEIPHIIFAYQVYGLSGRTVEYAHPLPEVEDVRRRVESDFQSRCGQC